MTAPADRDPVVQPVPRALTLALGLERLTSQKADQRIAAFRELAYREWLGWLSGRRRPDSIPALERSRLLDLFALRDEAPTVQALVEEFGLTEGRAIAQVARMQFGAARLIRARRLRELADTLDKLVRAQPAPTSAARSVPIYVPRRWSQELERFFLALTEAEDQSVTMSYAKQRDAYGASWERSLEDWTRLTERLRADADAQQHVADEST